VTLMFSIAGFSLKIISPVRSNSGPRPSASESSHASPSCPSFDQMKLEMIKRMQKADKSKSDVKSAVRSPISFPSASSSSESSLGFVP
jgi:hypothetical protein